MIDLENPSEFLSVKYANGQSIDASFLYRGDQYFYLNNSFQRVILGADNKGEFLETIAPDFWEKIEEEKSKAQLKTIGKLLFVMFDDHFYEIDLNNGNLSKKNPECSGLTQILRDQKDRTLAVCKNSIILETAMGWISIANQNDLNEKGLTSFNTMLIDKENRLWLEGGKANAYIWLDLPN